VSSNRNPRLLSKIFPIVTPQRRIEMNTGHANNQPSPVASRCQVPWDRSDPTQEELTALLNSLKHDPTLMGILSLGRDGVMRSLTADRRVVDAVGLTPAQITAFVGRVPPGSRAEYEVYDGADGTKVPREQWFAPDRALLPEPMKAEDRERIERTMQEREERGEGSVKAQREEMESRGMKFA